MIKKSISVIAFLACLAVFLYSAFRLYSYYRTYEDGKKEYEELKGYTSRQEDADGADRDGSGRKKDKCPLKVDFEALSRVNKDVAGWIYIPDTEISYPIVQSEDNDYYLHRTFEKKKSYVGAIFLDALCKRDFSSTNSIIYGHNLKNGEMFGHLKPLYDKAYNSKADYRKHPVIWIITPEKEMEYGIFSVREISTSKDMEVYTIEFAGREDYKDFLSRQVRASLQPSGQMPADDAAMITLSTCTSRSEEGRFIVQAARIQ